MEKAAKLKKGHSAMGVKKSRKTGVQAKTRVNLKDPERNKDRSKSSKGSSKLHFHLGGDYTDPLNLNSLINRDPSEVTPQCSPFVDRGKMSPCIIIPPDLKDPLNLKCDINQDIIVVSSAKKKRKRKRNDSGCYEGTVGKKENIISPKIKEKTNVSPKIKKKKKEGKKKEKREKETEIKVEKKKEESALKVKQCEEDISDKREEKMNENKKTEVQESIIKTKNDDTLPKKEKTSSKNKSKKAFIYGNYNRYYGYRNCNIPDDSRLKLFQKSWFLDNDVLDIGCNIGNITLQIARDFSPKHVLGIDIDSSLIRTANKNLRCAVQEHVSKNSKQFPMSFMICRGPIVPVEEEPKEGTFPYNVSFQEQNFVLPNKSSSSKQEVSYDVILCLSLTKWIHLNWGDDGIKKAFKRMFLMLRPGGRLLLEAQPLASYARRKNLSEKIRHNYDNIRFTPNQFVDYLMSEDVGFASYESLGVSENTSKGFQRPLYLFTKSSSGKCYDALGESITDSSHYYFD